MKSSHLHPTGGRRRLSSVRLGLLAIAVLLLLSRFAAIYTENVNWDEFALLKNAARTAVSGELHGGGRPGLAVLLLLPLVSECRDEIAAVHAARLLWLGFTLTLLCGLAALVLQLGESGPGEGERRDRWQGALLALALVVFFPAFLEASIQVRSDQVALAAGLWAGTALLASRRRPVLAAVAGLLFGLGFLASQKLLYIGGLTALLAVGQLWLDRELRPRREAARVGLCAAALLAVVAAFPWITGLMLPAQAAAGSSVLGASLSNGLGVFDFYRRTIGYSEYRALLPFLSPHALMAALLLYATLPAQRGQGQDVRRLALAWAVLLLGSVVAVIHAAAFAYFWMTLGLFPAVAFALAHRPLQAALPAQGRARIAIAAGLGAIIAVPGLMQAGFMLRDSQANQRASLSFIQRNFAGGEDGFHPEGALFCRLASPPFPIYFSQHLYAQFGRNREIGKRSASELIEGFESRQVHYLLESWRLKQFPDRVRQFWLDHYQPYRGSVLVAGRYFAAHEPVSNFELVVDGEYRWIPLSDARPLSLDGLQVPPGGRVRLERGPHRSEDPGHGYLVLALAEPPGAAELPFYRSD